MRLALGYAGLVEHIIFVEPPWSPQCADMHNRTAVLKLARDQEGKSSQRRLGSTSLSSRHVAVADEDGTALHVLHGFFEHDQVRHCRSRVSLVRSSPSKILKPWPTTRCGQSASPSSREPIPCSPRVCRLVDAEAVVPSLMPTDADLILDVDLDFFSTTSPGALSLVDNIPDPDDLAAIYRLAYASYLAITR